MSESNCPKCGDESYQEEEIGGSPSGIGYTFMSECSSCGFSKL